MQKCRALRVRPYFGIDHVDRLSGLKGNNLVEDVGGIVLLILQIRWKDAVRFAICFSELAPHQQSRKDYQAGAEERHGRWPLLENQAIYQCRPDDGGVARRPDHCQTAMHGRRRDQQTAEHEQDRRHSREHQLIHCGQLPGHQKDGRDKHKQRDHAAGGHQIYRVILFHVKARDGIARAIQ